MTEVLAIVVKAVEGFMLADDKSHALVGLVTDDEQRIALAVTICGPSSQLSSMPSVHSLRRAHLIR
jgi:hypothetical protein